MFEAYTFFKNKDGAMYGVSPRVIAGGFVPEEGHFEVTREEKEEFIQKAIDNSSQEYPKTQKELQLLALELKDKGVLPFGVEQITGINIDN
jgi:hypothetical protein